MPKPCSLELRERVVDAVESGASRREAADWFEVSPSSAIKWMQRRQATGSIAPKPSGGSISPLEAHAAFLFTLIARQSDLTLDEIVAAMHKRRIAGSRSAVWRFLQRHKISVKKKSAGGGARAGGCGAAQRRCQAETPLIALCRFPGPALIALPPNPPTNRTNWHSCPEVHIYPLSSIQGSARERSSLFAQAQSAEQSGDIVEAERLYRLLIKSDPADASAPFNLGNMLRAHARNIEAEAAFRSATRTDPTFAEAWYNLGDLLDDQGRTDAAVECLRKALRAAPDYADAMFNLALLLQRKNQYPEAADYWRRYLASDSRSDWATRARRSLKFCEMQSHLSASA